MINFFFMPQVQKHIEYLITMQKFSNAHAKVFIFENLKFIKKFIRENKNQKRNDLKKNLLHHLTENYFISDFCFDMALGYVGKNTNVCAHKEFYYYVGAFEDAFYKEIENLMPKKNITVRVPR